MADKYGIPAGGDAYPGKVKYYKGDKSQLQDVGIAVAVAEGGWPESLIPEAVSVVIAESGGHPSIYNTYKKGHFGLFQVSRSAWPDFFAGDSENWRIATRSAQQGYKIYQQQGWKAWQASRLTHLARGREAAKDLKNLSAAKRKEYADVVGSPLGSIADQLPDDPTGLGDLADSLAPKWAGDLVAVVKDAYEALTTPAFWLRVAYGGAGVVLLAGGLFLIVRNTPAAKAAAGAAGKVASVVPAGRAVKAVKGAGK